MWQKTPEELRAVLSAPFSSSDIEWRVSATHAEKTKGLAVPYVTNRAIQNRLDDTVGIDGWYNDFRPWKNGSAQLCGISIFFPQLEQCLTKWDGADDSEFESVKGGLSDSMKRAAVEWSIGRYLYGMTQVWVTVQITNSGKKSNARIRDEERPRLDQAHDEWVAYLQAKERGENPPRPKAPPPLKAQKGQNGPPAQPQGQYQAPPQGAQQRPQQGQGRPPAQPQGRYQAPPQGAQQYPQQGQGRPPAQPQGQYQTPPQGAQQRPQQGQGSRPIPRGCLLVTGARLKNTINGGQRLSLQLADENNSVFQAYLRELDTRIAPGVLLSDAQITTQNKGGVVLYILESYQIVGSPEENAA